MTQSSLEQPRQTSQEISNLLDVSARTASETPRAFYDELHADITKHLPQTIVRVAEGVGIGLATTVLLKMPRIAPIVGLVGLAYTGYEAVTGGADFIGRATKADTQAQRETMAHSSAQQLGVGLSALVESAPGMIAGGWLASIKECGGPPPLYSRIGNAVDRNVLTPAKDSIETNILSPVRQGYAFRGPGSVKLSAALVNQDGEFDALGASKMLAQRHPWQGVETGSSLDLNNLRMSRVVTGQASDLGSLPGMARDNVVPFHIHGPKATAGFLPSNVDIAATPGLGILQQGDKTTFYVGQAREYAALAKTGWSEYFSPSLKAVVVDNKTGLAQRFTGKWLPGTAGLQLDAPVTLDSGQLLETLSRARATSPWKALEAVAAKTGG